MAVITVSRQFGSGGDEIVEQLCQVLGYRFFDKRMLAKAAIDAGLSDQEIIDYSIENYKVKGFFERLFGRSRPIATTRVWKEGTDGTRKPEEVQLTEEHALQLVQKAVEMAYQTGNMVIEGRGGQVLLRDRAGVLHVRIVAPMEYRIQRVKEKLHEEQNMPLDTIETRRAAQDMIEQRDAASAAYLKTYYGVDWADPLLYHAVLNTGRISLEQAVRCITDMLIGVS